MSDPEASHSHQLPLILARDLVAKTTLVALVVLLAIGPAWGNLEGKAPTQRAFLYPVVAVVVPALFGLGVWRDAPYPWAADLLLTLVGFSDVLGNRLDLFDKVVWFHDGMHFAIASLVSAAVLLLTTDRGARLMMLLERSLAVAMTVSLAGAVGVLLLRRGVAGVRRCLLRHDR